MLHTAVPPRSEQLAKSDPAVPWYSAYPAPRNQTPTSVTASTVLQWLKEGRLAGKDFLLVDLRRTDYEGGTIRGSINLPAQTFYSSISTLYSLFSAAGVEKVIFYCGSSRGRGHRAAGWFDDYLTDHHDEVMKSYVLVDGIKAWATGGSDYVQFMDGYEEEKWKA